MVLGIREAFKVSPEIVPAYQREWVSRSHHREWDSPKNPRSQWLTEGCHLGREKWVEFMMLNTDEYRKVGA